MVVRRFRDHIARQDWFAVAIDVGIVVLGVFIGTQVSNLNESRIESQRAQDYRRRLLHELEFNGRQYEAQATYYRDVIQHGEAALEALDRPGADPSAFIIDAYQLTQMDQAPAKDYIYQELVAGGFVAGLGPESIQNVVSDYYLNVTIGNELIGQSLPYRDVIRGLVPFAWQAEIERKCGDRSVMSEGRLVGLSLAQKCAVRFPQGEASRVAAAIRNTPDMAMLMTRYATLAREKLGLGNFNRAETRTLIARLRQSQRRRP